MFDCCNKTNIKIFMAYIAREYEQENREYLNETLLSVCSSQIYLLKNKFCPLGMRRGFAAEMMKANKK